MSASQETLIQKVEGLLEVARVMRDDAWGKVRPLKPNSNLLYHLGCKDALDDMIVALKTIVEEETKESW